MTVKNTSSKIIAFGSNTLLPGDTCDLDKSWESNEVVKMYMDMNMLQRVEAVPGVTPDTDSNTTAVRVIPVEGADVGDTVEMGGLLGSAPVMPVHEASSADFIARGGLQVI